MPPPSFYFCLDFICLFMCVCVHMSVGTYGGGVYLCCCMDYRKECPLYFAVSFCLSFKAGLLPELSLLFPLLDWRSASPTNSPISGHLELKLQAFVGMVSLLHGDWYPNPLHDCTAQYPNHSLSPRVSVVKWVSSYKKSSMSMDRSASHL